MHTAISVRGRPGLQAHVVLTLPAAVRASRPTAAVASLSRLPPNLPYRLASAPMVVAETTATPSSSRHGATLQNKAFPGRRSSGGERTRATTRTQASNGSAWETLGLKANANTAQIKKAYRKLVMLYHPDVAEEGNTEEKFQQIHEAYLILQGKLDGQTASSGDKAWDFHDWYWNFAAKHRKRGAGGHVDGGFAQRSEGQQAVTRAKVSQQLQHLKARARCRSSNGSSQPEAVAPPEVHPAWVAVSASHDIPTAERSRGTQEPCQEKSGQESAPEPQPRPHSHHRPAGIGRGHLAAQLSGLRRKSQMRDRVAA
mmetsp:Transcript_284/g.749  ORF Transcript_284/g.749 Transcript_284/m.749 type:complete len:313 (-) Transcript_284:245-1183(-)